MCPEHSENRDPIPWAGGRENPAQWGFIYLYEPGGQSCPGGLPAEGLQGGEGGQEGAQNVRISPAEKRELGGVCTVTHHRGTALHATNIISNLGQYQFLN